MNTRAMMSVSLSALMLGGAMVGCSATGGGLASASSRDAAVAHRQAAADANHAEQALAKHKPAQAVRFAEAAVALQPADADYRVLLGQSYLKAGRFTSARAAFADALTLSPDSAKAALNLSLVQIGLGQWAAARTTLDDHARVIPIADRGLAMALAGDPAGAVQVLTEAARTPGADVKARQNLALALALAGRWQEARAIAAMDLSPADVDGRLTQWAAFAHPTSASDQVAAMLGVSPVEDAGQPVALALAAPAPIEPTAVAPVKAAVVEPVPTPSASRAPEVAGVASPAIRFAAPIAVVQSLPAAASRPVVTRVAVAKPAPTTVAVRPSVAAVAVPAKGDWYVQVGAFENAGVARAGWARAVRLAPALKAQTPYGSTFGIKGAQVYRLSVGGFTRQGADTMCHAFRAHGGGCFVRAGAGDQVAQWAKGEVRLASR